MSRRGRKTRNRRPRNRPSTTQPRTQAPTPSTPLRLVLGGPHATPVRPLPARPHTTQSAAPQPSAPQPPTDQYARLVDEVTEYADMASIYAGAIGIHAPRSWWTGLSSTQAICHLPDGVALVHTPGEGITAHRPCPGGNLHTATVRSHPDHAPGDIQRFRIDTDECHGHQPLPPAGPRVLPLHDKPREHTHHEP